MTDCENMFWGVTVDSGKRYSQTVEEGFRVTMAALENKADSTDYVQVLLQQETSEFLLCTLQHGKLLQQPLDLAFNAGETVSFSLNGSGTVHLTGYLVTDELRGMEADPDWDESMYNSEEMEESTDEEDEDAPELVTSIQGKRKAEGKLKKSKKIKLLNEDGEEVDESEEEDSDEDSDEEEEEEFSDDFGGDSFLTEEAEEDDEDDEDDDTDEDDREDEMETSVDQTPVKSAKKKKLEQQKATPKSPKQNEKTPKANGKTPKQNGKTPKQNGETPKQNGETPKQNGETPKAGESQKKGKKAQTPKVETAEIKESASPVSDAVATPDGEKKKKKKKKNKKKDVAGGDADTSVTNTPTSVTKTTPKKKVVSGGTMVEDVKDGHGPEARAGKMVGVYYRGVLQKNNKQFDSCLQGKPFRFRLGKGEVIKGWDNGVSGMKVGGKRKITVPANQGYGNRSNGPIPANSVLVFEVELKSVT